MENIGAENTKKVFSLGKKVVKSEEIGINKDVSQMYAEEAIVQFVKRQRIGWLGVVHFSRFYKLLIDLSHETAWTDSGGLGEEPVCWGG